MEGRPNSRPDSASRFRSRAVPTGASPMPKRLQPGEEGYKSSTLRPAAMGQPLVMPEIQRGSGSGAGAAAGGAAPPRAGRAGPSTAKLPDIVPRPADEPERPHGGGGGGAGGGGGGGGGMGSRGDEATSQQDANRIRAIRRSHKDMQRAEDEIQALRLRVMALEGEQAEIQTGALQEVRAMQQERVRELEAMTRRLQTTEAEAEDARKAAAELGERATAGEAAAEALGAQLRQSNALLESSMGAEGAVRAKLSEQTQSAAAEEGSLHERLLVLESEREQLLMRAADASAKAETTDKELIAAFGEVRKLRLLSRNLSEKAGKEQNLGIRVDALEQQLENTKAILKETIAKAQLVESSLGEELELEKEQRANQGGRFAEQLAGRDQRIEGLEITCRGVQESIEQKDKVLAEMATTVAMLEGREQRLQQLMEGRERSLLEASEQELLQAKQLLVDTVAEMNQEADDEAARRDDIEAELNLHIRTTSERADGLKRMLDERTEEKGSADAELLRRKAQILTAEDIERSFGKHISNLKDELMHQKNTGAAATKKMMVARKGEERKVKELEILQEEHNALIESTVPTADFELAQLKLGEAERMNEEQRVKGREEMLANVSKVGKLEGDVREYRSELDALKAERSGRAQMEATMDADMAEEKRRVNLGMESLRLKVAELSEELHAQSETLNNANEHVTTAQASAVSEQQASRRYQAAANEMELKLNALQWQSQTHEQNAQAKTTEVTMVEHRLTELLEFTKNELSQAQQQKVVLQQLLALNRRMHNKERYETEMPLREDLDDIASYLGIDLAAEPELLWIAEEAYFAPVPEGHEQHTDSNGDVYYFNMATKESSYCHPMDNYFRRVASSFSGAASADRQEKQAIADSTGMQLESERTLDQLDARLSSWKTDEPARPRSGPIAPAGRPPQSFVRRM